MGLNLTTEIKGYSAEYYRVKDIKASFKKYTDVDIEMNGNLADGKIPVRCKISVYKDYATRVLDVRNSIKDISKIVYVDTTDLISIYIAIKALEEFSGAIDVIEEV
jgi:hypothetical protein